ncbi:MAG TPA: hypothetical protein VI318_14045 [Baekduia sp.]
MLTRRLLAPLAAACALAAIPAISAQAAMIQTFPLNAPAGGVAVDGLGHVHVIETATQTDAIFSADGTLLNRVTLPGPAGTAEQAESAADGSVWVAIDASGPDAALARVSPGGDVTSTPTGGLFGCGPTGMTATGGYAFAISVIFTAPDGGSGCSPAGIGRTSETGSGPTAMSTLDDSLDVTSLNDGRVFAPSYLHDVVNRLAYSGASASVAATVPADSGPDQIVGGYDGKVYVTLYDSGQVARFDPNAADGTAATIVLSGLQHPGGISKGPWGNVWVSSHDDGRLVEISPPGAYPAVTLPAGFHPAQLAANGNDLWVVDDEAPRVARLVDDPPTVSITAASAKQVTVDVQTGGSATQVTIMASHGWGAGDAGQVSIPAGVSRLTIPVPFDVPLGAGDWSVNATASNARGHVTTAPVSVHVDAPPAVPTPAPKPAAPKKPKLADLVSYAATKRCVATRTLKLSLHKRKAGQVTVTSLRVTVGKAKAKAYTSKQLKKALTLKGLPKKGSVKVKVVATLSDHTTISQTLTYKVCAPKHHR